jgi:hypothetical protein
VRYLVRMTLKAVTIAEIERIFAVLERLDISREAVVIPLRPAHPGGVRRLPNGKFEITVESETPFDEWLPELERLLAAAAGPR